MRVERIARDKVRIFISYDDLEERGIDRDEIWHNGKKVQELFWDMMETAYLEVGFEIAGPIAVEAFTMPSEGVVVIVTRIPNIPGSSPDEDADDDEILDNQDDLDGPFVFQFSDLEDVIRAAHCLVDYSVDSALYQYSQAYFLSVSDSLGSEEAQQVWSILREYGEPSSQTSVYLDEYGHAVFRERAIENVVGRFPLL